jgi:hypothetical protein
MTRGPLPTENPRRRNQPTIPSTSLPKGGRKGPIPKCPLELGDAGRAWWRWAWRLPQATRWDAGARYFVARRAVLEDHAVALRFDAELDLGDLFDADNQEAARRVEWALGMLKRSASGEVALFKEMRELDNRLGLNPKAMGDLRWTIDGGAEAESEPKAGAEVRRLRAVG